MGSTEVAKLILQASAGNLKRVSLEHGGKPPNVIFPDADLETAVPNSVFGFTMLSGQVCCAARAYCAARLPRSLRRCPRPLYPEGQDRRSARSKTTVGPLVSKEQFDRVKGYLAVGKNDGAKTAAESSARDGKGYFVNPTVFVDMNNDMKIAREEIFGPVAAVIPFKDENDAVLQDNDTTYGLAAAV